MSDDRPHFSNINNYSGVAPLNNFKAAINKRLGLSRAYLFDVEIVYQFSDGIVFNDTDIAFYARSTTLPSCTIETSPVYCMGMAAQVPGRRTYEPLTITFYNTNDYDLYHKFARWQALIRGSEYGSQRDLSTTGQIRLTHYTGTPRVIETYMLEDAFPTSISGLSFSHDNETEAQTFEVTFAYRYFYMQYVPDQTRESVIQSTRPRELNPSKLPVLPTNIRATGITSAVANGANVGRVFAARGR